MKKILAKQQLKTWSRFKFSKVYDLESFPQWAIFILNPNFEYPAWSFQTIGYFLSKH